MIHRVSSFSEVLKNVQTSCSFIRMVIEITSDLLTDWMLCQCYLKIHIHKRVVFA